MKKILLAISTFFVGASPLILPIATYAATCGGVETAILGCTSGADNGCAIIEIIGVVLDIMTVCIGILAAIGITIVGIQYMTAGDKEEQVRKSKRRMFEIVLGLAAFVLLYALLKWLGIEPGLATCGTTPTPAPGGP